MKAALVLITFAVIVVLAWFVHPVLSVCCAFVGYGVIDGILSK